MNSPPAIDFVITWVDGSDPAWQREKARYLPDAPNGDIPSRYRDWGLLRYWFRGVERFAPWVRRIHLVTCGHTPAWLKADHPRLHIVAHADYLPADACPTFNSNAIELSMHRIAGLAEHFVYFNDDMFLLQEVTPGFFFKNGLPRDDAILSPVMPNWGEEIARTVQSNMFLINKHFQKRQVLRDHGGKFFSPLYGAALARTVCLLPWRHFPGFLNDHLPIPYRKSTFEAVWQKEATLLNRVTCHRFRDYGADLSIWLMRYWQFCSGSFVPASPRRGKDLDIASPQTLRAIRRQQWAMICINDQEEVDASYPQIRAGLIDAFDSILPKPSSFEKDVP